MPLPGPFPPQNPSLILGHDGTLIRAILVDATGKIIVNVPALPLPAGAATLAEQQIQSNWLDSINGYVLALGNALASVAVDKLRVSVIDSALPAGAATEATLLAAKIELTILTALVAALNSSGTDSLLVKVINSVLPTGASTSALQTALNAALKSVNTDKVEIEAAALPLPAGAATSALQAGVSTSANQATEITALQLIDDLQKALKSVNTDKVEIEAAALPLPAGAATSALQAGVSTAANQVIENTSIQAGRRFKVVTVTVALAAVAAGATRTEVNIAGNGFFLGHSMYIDGAAVGCANTRCNVYIDGEGAPSISVRCNSYTNDLPGWTYAAAPGAANTNTSPVGWGGQYDLANFIFTGGFQMESHFKASLQVDVVNGDPANATSIKSVTWYAVLI